MIDFQSFFLPFGANDVLVVVVQIVGILGGLILLPLALHFTPLLISLIFKAVGQKEKSQDAYFEQIHKNDALENKYYRMRRRFRG